MMIISDLEQRQKSALHAENTIIFLKHRSSFFHLESQSEGLAGVKKELYEKTPKDIFLRKSLKKIHF